MFAKKGYVAVSLKEIAAEIGIKAASLKEIAAEIGIKAASLYNYSINKEDLLNSVIDNAENLYLQYFARLEEAIGRGISFEHTVGSIFAELPDVVQIFPYYCFSFVLTEQFRMKKAGRLVNEIFLKFFEIL